MKSKSLRFSIFILLLSILTCGFVSLQKESKSVYAVETSVNDCYSLIDTNGNVYLSNSVAGTVEGMGKFVVGAESVSLTATANANFQLVGWQVTYKEQKITGQDGYENDIFAKVEDTDDVATITLRKEYFKLDDIVTLTALDGREISATLGNTVQNGYTTKSTFTLVNVFEDLVITPVFDHIYYQVDVSNAFSLLNLYNTDNEHLYFKNSDTYLIEANQTFIKYTNAILKQGDKYYYYGDLFKRVTNLGEGNEEINYFTVHQTLEETPRNEEIDYTRGAFRFGDDVELNFDVKISTDKATIKENIQASKNIDLQSVSVNSANNLSLYDSENPSESYFKFTQDGYKRTTSFEIKFQIQQNNDYSNTVVLNYHNLYFVDIELTVDGASVDSDTEKEVLGIDSSKTFEDCINEDGDFDSNVKVTNFYSYVDLSSLQFFAKSASDNNLRAFGVECFDVAKTLDNVTYKYYNINTIDGDLSDKKTYNTPSENITINYTSEGYKVEFGILEYVSGSLNDAMTGHTLNAIILKRGESISLNKIDGQQVYNEGYEFVGYTSSKFGGVEETTEYTIAQDKPSSTVIYLCFKKIEFAVEVEGFNDAGQVDGKNAVSSVDFKFTHSVRPNTESYPYTDGTTGTTTEITSSMTLTDKLKMGETLEINTTINNGFKVQYSLEGANPEDFITSFTVDNDFVQKYLLSYATYTYNEDTWSTIWDKLYTYDYDHENYVLNESQGYVAGLDYHYQTNTSIITIYAYEEVLTYELTYVIDPSDDSNFADKVIMADISVDEFPIYVDVEKFAIDTIEENGTVTYKEWVDGDIVAKIVVSKLKYKDTVKLSSVGKTVNEGEDNEYTYSFNWFTETGLSTLEKTKDGNKYSHEAKIEKSTTITVSYSMPKTQIKLVISNSLPTTFTYSIAIKDSDGEVLSPDGNGFYSVEVSSEVTISILDIPFGYLFEGYIFDGETDVEDVDGPEFTYIAQEGNNILELQFSEIKYQFNFYEDGNATSNRNTVLTVSNLSYTMTKTTGYYVSSVKFKNGEAISDIYSTLQESNDDRNNEDKSNYEFNLTLALLEEIANAYGVEKTINNEQRISIDVLIEYELFKYNITVNYGITNKTTNTSSVQFPAIKMTYTYAGVDSEIVRLYTSLNVNFTGIQYGSSDTRIEVLSGAPIGLKFAGWFVEETMITQEDYLHASNYIKLGFIDEDLSFSYMLSYTAYNIRVNYDSSQGSPTILINNSPQNDLSNIQITLGDKLEISANALTDNGYKFKSINYFKSVYESYVYTDESTWNVDWANLYLKSGSSYVKNTSSDYDSTKEYYVYKYETAEYVDSAVFSVEFSVMDYYINGNNVNFEVVYELKQLTISNAIAKIKASYGTASKGIWKAGADSGEIQFKVAEFLSYEMIAINQYGVQREIDETSTVTFKDTIQIYVYLNKAISNQVDGVTYDLSLGVVLYQYSINNESAIIVSSSNRYEDGVYLIEFNVGQNKPVQEEISVEYYLEFISKSVSVTTVVNNSKEFYKNIQLNINARNFGFAPGNIQYVGWNKEDSEVSEQVVLQPSGGLQFLAYVRFSAALSEDYKKYFYISGVEVYCNGKEVKLNQNGITVGDDMAVYARVNYNIQVVYLIQPIISYNGGPNFEADFKCDNEANAISQTLTVGSEVSNNIIIADILKDFVSVTYKSTAVNSVETTSVTDSGVYNVIVRFNESTDYDWLQNIEFNENLTLTIKQKTISLIYDAVSAEQNKITRKYNGSSNFDVEGIYKYLQFTDNTGLLISYSDLLIKSGSDLKLDQAIRAYISSGGKDERISIADESTYYNIYVYNIALKQSDFNNNFKLNTEDLIIKNYIQITRKKLTVSGISVFNKVYDGTTNAEIISLENLVLSGKISGDDVVVNGEKLNLQFETADVGTNKKVLVGISEALGGKDMNNYYISDVEVEGVIIYPYEVGVDVENVGKVSLLNIRGLTEKDKVDLIPLDATLFVEPIYADSSEYASIYGKIARYLKGNNEYAVGYTVSMIVNGEKVEIDKNLYLSVPNVKNLTGAYFLTGSQTGSVDYKYNGGYLVMDLSQINFNINSFFLTQKKILLKAWQIVLIVIMAVLVVAAVVLTVVILRRRKHKEYSVHDKI